MFNYFSNVAPPFGMVRHNFVNIVQGNIFGLATEENNLVYEMVTSQKSFLTSRFSQIYKVSTLDF